MHLQRAAEQAAPWTVAQIHDTVAKIASQPVFDTESRQSLLGRLLRYLWDRFADFVSLFSGTIDPRTALFLAIGVVATVVIARAAIVKRYDDVGLRHRLSARAFGRANVDYWNLARDDAAAGRYAEACHALYAAVIDTLVRDRLVTFHASKTSGDYARDLRGGQVHADFLGFARQCDRTIFGVVDVTADDYIRLRALAERAARVRAAAA